MLVPIDLTAVGDWGSFHDVFAFALGFMDGYVRTMSAWIDCLTDVDEDDGTSTTVLDAGEMLTLQLLGTRELRRASREIFETLIDSAAFVNWRRIETGDQAILALSHR